MEFAWDRAVGALGASVVAASAPPTAGEGADIEPEGQLADRTPVGAILTYVLFTELAGRRGA